MEKEAKPYPVAPPASSKPHPDDRSSNSLSSSSSPEVFRHFQAAFKRHRSIGAMQGHNNLVPKRVVPPQRVVSEPDASAPSTAQVVGPTMEPLPSSVPSQLLNVKRKVQFSTATSGGADDRMATGLDNVSSHMGSLALTESEWDPSSRVDNTSSSAVDNESKYRNVGTVAFGNRTTVTPKDELHSLRNFLIQPTTQSSVVGASCATTTLVNSTSAPMISSTTYSSRSHQECGPNAYSQHRCRESLEQFPVQPRVQYGQVDNKNQASTSAFDSAMEGFQVSREQHGLDSKPKDPKNHCFIVDKPTRERELSSDVGDVQAQPSMSKNLSLGSKSEPLKTEKQEKTGTSMKGASGAPKRNYDPDKFFKVNGKLYQRLGKIGSGGSSEVYKVISSDCTIYALKKIKLRGRDYATAIGFCQEIEYLNRLKGKTNIIQLIDYCWCPLIMIGVF